MPQIEYEAALPGIGGHVDAVVGDTAIEVLTAPKDVKNLKAALMLMARVVSGESVNRAVLMLDEPQITQARLLDEWNDAASIFRPELFNRLSMFTYHSGEWTGVPTPPEAQTLPALDEIRLHCRSQQKAPTSRVDFYHEIFRILVHEWLLGRGPTPIRALLEMSGASHPTISRALDRLSPFVKRHSDRSVELRFFPREEWAKVVAVSDDLRSTIRFVDRSGQSRSPESLLGRLRRLQREDVAVGGVLGAKHYDPNLDIIGNARLDLTIHTAGKAVDLAFIKRLDPALEQTRKRTEAPTLVIHTLRRAASLFQKSSDGLLFADPVECLLDLHEARLEPQALDFLHALRPQ